MLPPKSTTDFDAVLLHNSVTHLSGAVRRVALDYAGLVNKNSNKTNLQSVGNLHQTLKLRERMMQGQISPRILIALGDHCFDTDGRNGTYEVRQAGRRISWALFENFHATEAIDPRHSNPVV